MPGFCLVRFLEFLVELMGLSENYYITERVALFLFIFVFSFRFLGLITKQLIDGEILSSIIIK